MLKKITTALCFLLIKQLLWAQLIIPKYSDALFSTYYHQRLAHFRALPQTSGDIVFAGNSITDGAEWSELFNDIRVKNRGISGDITAGVINRINEIANRKPAKVFLLIGVNDLAKNISPDSVVKNILFITDYLNQQLPATKVFVQSILPVNKMFGKFGEHTGKGQQINKVNAQLKNSASTHHFTYVDIHSSFADKNGKLNSDFTNDGLHLAGAGYLLWKHLICPHVYDLQEKPALIPLPQNLKWEDGYFPLYDCKSIVIKNSALQKEAVLLQQKFAQRGWVIKIENDHFAGAPFIELQLGKVEVPQLADEAYRLEVGKEKIIITANTAHGIFNAIQTLEQLMRDGVMVNACKIIDWPAFSWRGYMIDVGRNYQSINLLKQQIDVMAKYKLNVFHFHPTEDIAWRIAIKQYPQLTAPENMLRDKGLYYSEADIKELIAFCKERYITFVPEIDMPGHSNAFKRAMKTDMQSDSGLIYVKNILKEFCQTYDVPYLHIGADEVKITNKNFIPDVTAYVQSFGKKVIGWEPGGNFSDNTIRQLWMDDNGHGSSNAHIQYIDSRHLYLNHMDPLEAVVTIFNRKIANKEKGDNVFLGGTICMWHDRAVANENDVQKMNPVYPAILAFGERTWRGGGYEGWVANIGEPSAKATNEFAEFENRLLDHRQQYFLQLPFPYARQSTTVWKLYGPFNNDGDLSRQFEPQNKNFDTEKTSPALQIVGGTIVLRHWWYPLIKGAIKEPKENTTWYASTKIWSDEDTVQNFWIGFNNLSRSPATDSPPKGAWDEHQSSVWVNGELIAPPQWKRGGQKGNSEIPLIDEGYEYRAPTKLLLRKGWNEVLIKSPVGSFKGKSWQNPVKWMFTFVPAS